MIIATVELRGTKEKRREILQTICGLDVQVRRMKGCCGVNSYQDVDNHDNFFHVEKWQTVQALDGYLNSNLFSALLGIKSILIEKPRVKFMASENITLSRKDAAHPYMILLKEQNGVK